MKNVELVPAVKYFDDNVVLEIITKGFVPGFNTLQQLETIKPEVFDFIGHIQSNKLKKILALNPRFIHSVDSEKILQKISTEKPGQKILLQFKTDPDKNYGFDVARYKDISIPENLELCGIMTISKIGDVKAFKTMHKIASYYEQKFAKPMHISMGTSKDYDLAIKYGATIVRVGRHFFDVYEKFL
ncbi:MAG: hypothetical protein ACMXYK_01830 [Candidatus Woesearchaeota archaeon]